MKYEFRKINHHLVILLIIILVLSHFIICFTHLFGSSRANGEKLYQEIAEQYEGSITQEKLNQITEEYDYVCKIISQESIKESDYINDAISYEDYSKYRNELHECKIKEQQITKIYQQIILDNEKNTDFINDTYLQYLLNPTRIEWLLFGIFVILFLFSYSTEKRSILNICSCTKCGINRIRKQKLKWNMLVCFTFTTLFTFVELLLIIIFDGVTHLSAPVISVETVREYSIFNISVLSMIGLRFIFHFITGFIILLIIELCFWNHFKQLVSRRRKLL